MTRFLTKMAVVIVTVTLLATTAMAQGWGRWATASPQDQQKIADLHQKIRTAQWELWTLKSQNADQKKIEQKTTEVLKLRGELAKIMTNLPPGPCYQLSQGGTAPSAIWTPGLGRRGGFGMGFRGGCGGPGMCWRWQLPALPSAATQ
ncbi:MAG: hypothetical protein ACUVX8_09280 [Candidatus Zipacnadales bacterium]